MRRLYSGMAVLLVLGMVGSLTLAQVKAPPKDAPPKTDKEKDKDKDKDKPSVTEIGGKTLKQWISECYSKDPGVRENAVRTIMLFGDAGAPAAPILTYLLGDQDVSLRVNACLALAAIDVSGDDIKKAVDALGRRLVDDREAIVKFHAAIALATFGRDAIPAIPNLALGSKDQTSWEIRKASCHALSRVGAGTKKEPADNQAAAALVYALNNDQAASVRLEAAIALGGIGKTANPAEHKVVEDALKGAANKDYDSVVQIWAAVGYMAFTNDIKEPTLKLIADRLKSPELRVRCEAARALGIMGTKAETQVDNLMILLKDKQRDAIIAGIMAISQMGDAAQKVIPTFKELAESKDADEAVKQAAKAAIEVITQPKKKPEK